MNPPTDWTSAIAIGVAGLILGALLIYFFTRRKAGPTIDGDLERKDLEAKRDALVAQLRALPDDAVDERARLESEAAVVLRKLDQKPNVEQTLLSARSRPMDPTTKGFLWGSASTAALAALLYFVMQAATPRPEGEMATGGIGTQPQQQAQAAANDPVIRQLEAAVQKDPNNTTARLDLAQLYLERDNMMGVFEQTRVVLERDPNNSRALTLAALVRMAMGEADSAVQMLQQATSSDPANLDSRVALAWIYAQTGRVPQAEAAIADAVRISPENKARLENVLAQMKAHAAMPQDGGAAVAPAADAPAGAPAVPAGPSVTVNISLDPGARSRTGVLFVIARNSQGGPPVAVKRVMASSFPVTVQLTSADSMLGQPLPESFSVEARLDSDGNATTKPPTDPSGFRDGVNMGAAVSLSLK